MDRQTFDHYVSVNKLMAGHADKIAREMWEMSGYGIFVSVEEFKYSDTYAKPDETYALMTFRSERDIEDVNQICLPMEVFLGGVEAYLECKSKISKGSEEQDSEQIAVLKQLMDKYPEEAKQYFNSK